MLLTKGYRTTTLHRVMNRAVVCIVCSGVDEYKQKNMHKTAGFDWKHGSQRPWIEIRVHTARGLERQSASQRPRANANGPRREML